MMLTVVIDQPTKEQLDRLKFELKSIEHTLLTCSAWEHAIKVADSDYITFIENDSDISDGFFKDNLHLFKSKPLFRKMAMISAAVDESGTINYGYFFSNKTIFPSHLPSSSRPYAIQAGFLGGSIVRTRVARSVGYKWLNKPVIDSANMSLAFWRRGNMCYINPKTIYMTPSDGVSVPRDYEGVISPEVMEVFKRELVK